MIKNLSDNYIRVTPAECSSVILELMTLYWDERMDEEAIARQQALWYVTLKEYSFKTIKIAAMDWIKNSRNKPTPADLLRMAKETDPTPVQMRSLFKISNITVAIPEPEPEGKMLGDPILLAKMMRIAKSNQIEFTEDQQLDYLATGENPSWYMNIPEIKEENYDPRPSREELLAQMSPAAQKAALQGPSGSR